MVKLTGEARERQQKKKAEFIGAFQKLGRADETVNTDISMLPLEDGYKMRPDVEMLNQLRAQNASPTPAKLLSLLDSMAPFGPNNQDRVLFDRTVILMRATIRREEGNTLFKAGNYVAAIQKYVEAMGYILTPLSSSQVHLPSLQYFSQPYLVIGECCIESGNGMGRWLEYMDILALGGNISQCYSKVGDHVQALKVLVK